MDLFPLKNVPEKISWADKIEFMYKWTFLLVHPFYTVLRARVHTD